MITEPVLSDNRRFFAEPVLEPELRPFASLRVTAGEELRMTPAKDCRLQKAKYPKRIPMSKLECQTKSQVQMPNAPAHFDIGTLGFESFVCHWDSDIGI